MDTSWKPYALLHFIILIWGFTGIIGALISPELSAVMIVWYRMGIAFVSLLLFMGIFFRKKFTFPTGKKGLKIIGVGCLTALHWVTFFHAIKISNVSIALACLASTTFFVSFIEPILFKRKIMVYEVILGLAVIVGLYLIFRFEVTYTAGIFVALASALLAALFGTFNGVLVKEHNPYTITLWEMLGGFLLLSLYLGVRDVEMVMRFFPTATDWMYLFILGIICTAFAFVVSVDVLKVISPFTASISINMEPVYAILLALWIFGEKEHMTTGFYAGAMVIFTTILINAYIKRRKRKAALKPLRPNGKPT